MRSKVPAILLKGLDINDFVGTPSLKQHIVLFPKIIQIEWYFLLS